MTFQLKTNVQGCTHIRYAKLSDSSPVTHIVGDLGVIVSGVFVASYPNAVIAKSAIKDFVEQDVSNG